MLMRGLALVLALAPLLAAPPDAEQERFLHQAEIVGTRPAGKGITGSLRASLAFGGLAHDAHVQSIHRGLTMPLNAERVQRNRVDSYKGNIAAYRLSRMLGLNSVPVSIDRRVNGVSSAVTWWVDDVQFPASKKWFDSIPAPDETAWQVQMDRMRVFDELIGNPDRHLDNMLIDKDWKLWLIDHSRAFRWHTEILRPELLQNCDPQFLAALQSLDKKQLKSELGRHLVGLQIDAILARRDRILTHFQPRP